MGIYPGSGFLIQKDYDGSTGRATILTSAGYTSLSFSVGGDADCHFVFRRSGQVFSIHQQGVLVNSVDIATATFTLSSDGFTLDQGAQDELSVYNYALSDERIDDHYRAGYSMFPDGR